MCVCARAPVLPWICRAVFQRRFVAGANMSSVTALSISCYKRGLGDRGKSKEEAQLCKTSFHVISVSGVTLLGLGARLEMDAALILSGLSLPLTHFYPNPCLFLLNHLTLFAYFHLPAHCYSLLSATPLSGSLYYVYVVRFPFLYLRYPLQTPHPTPSISLCGDCTNAFIEDCVLLHCTVCHFATSLL